MSNQVIRPKDRTEWLKYRESGIGSSEVATIVGLNPWETPYQLWRRKKGLDPAKQENFAMKAGHYLEDAVAQFFKDETGCEIIKCSAIDWMIINTEKPYMRVSPDRTYWLNGLPHNAHNKGILECKTTQMSIDPEDLPKHWFCQVQYQLGVAELQEASLAWLCSGREFGYKNLTFVPDFFKWLCEEVDRFWIDYIQGDKEPDPQNAKDILLKFNKHTGGKVIETTDEIFQAYSDLKDVKQQLAELSDRKTELEEKIKLGFGDAEALSYGGDTIATWKSPKPSEKFDDKAFKADHPDLFKEYAKTVQGARRFLLK